MKKTLAIATLLALITTSANARWGHHGQQGNRNSSVIEQVSTTQVATELTDEQKENLIFMYQEEKLARDVYITLGNIWNSRVFKNIQKSEQKHMNSVKYLLDNYNIPTPVLSDDIGVFENEELQALYNELIEKGSQSLQDALEVGVAIEEKDIADLEEKIEDAPSDVQRVFNNLLRGSYNHLKAFNSKL